MNSDPQFQSFLRPVSNSVHFDSIQQVQRHRGYFAGVSITIFQRQSRNLQQFFPIFSVPHNEPL